METQLKFYQRDANETNNELKYQGCEIYKG